MTGSRRLDVRAFRVKKGITALWVLLAFNVFFVLTVVAAYQPMITLIEGISNSNGR